MDYIELAKKLKALADRGHGGEKFNAEAKLKELMEKNGITEEQLSETERKTAIFKFAPSKYTLYLQIVSSIIGGKRAVAGRYNAKRHYFIWDVTPVEELEIRAQLDFWSRVYDEELEIFTHAFIQKNRLTPRDMQAEDPKNQTPEERKKMLKMFDLANALDQHSFTRNLPEKVE